MPLCCQVLLEKDPEARTWDRVLQHPFLDLQNNEEFKELERERMLDMPAEDATAATTVTAGPPPHQEQQQQQQIPANDTTDSANLSQTSAGTKSVLSQRQSSSSARI